MLAQVAQNTWDNRKQARDHNAGVCSVHCVMQEDMLQSFASQVVNTIVLITNGEVVNSFLMTSSMLIMSLALCFSQHTFIHSQITNT